MDPPTYLTPAEIEFVAEDELVEIVPFFALPRLTLIGGEFGPFAPQVPSRVPLWCAVQLKQKRLCRIKPPEWLSVEHLQAKLESERTSRHYGALPFQYQELAWVLIREASDDIPRVGHVRLVLRDIEEVRQERVRRNLHELRANLSAVKLNNLSAMEIASIRRHLVQALDTFHQMGGDDAQFSSDDYPLADVGVGAGAAVAAADAAASTVAPVQPVSAAGGGVTAAMRALAAQQAALGRPPTE